MQALPVAGGSGRLDVRGIVDGCVIDTKEAMDLELVGVCPALKLRLKTYLHPKSMELRGGTKRANGILLFGRPGTGKTALVHGLAREYGYMLYDLDPPVLLSKQQGDSEK